MRLVARLTFGLIRPLKDAELAFRITAAGIEGQSAPRAAFYQLGSAAGTGNPNFVRHRCLASRISGAGQEFAPPSALDRHRFAAVRTDLVRLLLFGNLDISRFVL